MSKTNGSDSPRRFVTVLQLCSLITVALVGVFFAGWLGDRVLACIVILAAVILMMLLPDGPEIASGIMSGASCIGLPHYRSGCNRNVGRLLSETLIPNGVDCRSQRSCGDACDLDGRLQHHAVFPKSRGRSF